MSAGIRSGVNWMRLKLRFSVRLSVLIIKRLGQARHAFQQAMAAAEEADEQFFDDRRLADDDLAQLVHDLAPGGIELLDGGYVLGADFIHRFRILLGQGRVRSCHR